MNSRENLREEIKKFIELDNEKVMLITGTHQYEKHMEVLRELNSNVSEGVKVLFRLNSADNIESIFQHSIKNKKLNTKIRVGNLNMYINTMNKKSWKNDKYNVSILYPLDSICRMKAERKEEVINDLLQNTIHKIFLVSWTDSQEYDWLNKFNIDRKVIFDAEEEDINYHNRVLENIKR